MSILQPPGLRRSDIRLKQDLIRVAVCAQSPLPDGIIDDTTNNSLNSRASCYAPKNSAITDIVLAFPGFALLNPEVDLPTATYTVTAAVEYPAGTFYPVYVNGNRSLTVTAGRAIYRFDPLPIVIPAGAQFFVKTYATWTAGHFILSTLTASSLTSDWTNRGTGLTDQTLTTSTFSTTSNAGGFAPIVYGRLASPSPVLGILGASQDAGASDLIDHFGQRFMNRAMRGVLPVINLARSGDSLGNYLLRPEGRSMVFRDAITHLIFGTMVSNSVYGTTNLGTLQTNYQLCIAPFLARGVRVYGMTVIPRTTSTDNWLTTANQTITAPTNDAVRKAFNAWIRGNYRSIGLSGLIDACAAVDPTDSSLWSADANAVNNGASRVASGYATISGGQVTAVSMLSTNSDSTSGSGYTPNSTVPCVVLPYPGDTGSGAVVVGNVNASGWVTTYTVQNGGSGYLYPPMVTPAAKWTGDGVHETSRGCNEVIYRTGLSPQMFVL